MSRKITCIFFWAATVVVCGFANKQQIPDCYLHFNGIKDFVFADSERKSMHNPNSTEFNIAKDKKVSVNLVDTYEADYENSNGDTNLSIEIELSDNPKFKQYVLAHYRFIAGQQLADPGKESVLEKFRINTTEVYGTTAKSIVNPNLGTYIILPTNNMAIYFHFLRTEDMNFKSLKDFKIVRDAFIRAYLKHVSACRKQ